MSTKTRWQISLVRLCTLAVLGCANTASAQQDDNDEKARQLFEQAKVLYMNGEYDAAAELFDQCYQLTGLPDFLYNMASAYEKAGRNEEALEMFRAYYSYASPEVQAKLDERIAQLEARIANDRRMSVESSPYTSWKWVTFAVGAALVVSGTFTFVLGELDHQEVADAQFARTMTQVEARDLVTSGDLKKKVGAAMWGVGGATLGACIVLFLLDEWLEPNPRQDSVPATSFELNSDGFGISFSWRF